ncbi:TonB-dependent receptor [Sphingopyxis sp. MWB1]|uniref:TonB-dependent receptor n=1 Tax=Sphingopyxis sp. MWB1 TaxID=1537715 RepID=UPI00068DD1E8|nr:TonB-dependent receptor [Sphingopyxis sp. MWB1]
MMVLAISATAAMAQTADSAADQEDRSQPASAAAQPSDNAIIVSGIRQSLASAIDRKKNAGTTVESIVAEDVAKFPDKNIGESLSRVTGVQLTRDFGEGVQVSIRGVEPDLNRVEVNGATTLGQGGRGNDFRELASELIKTVDVYKGYTVDLTEGGVGGTVSIQTRKPLELRDDLLVVSGAMQHVDTVGGWKPRATLVAGTKFLDDRVGVIVNATYDRNDTRGDFIRNTEWVRLGDLNRDGVKNTSNSNFDHISTLAGCNAVPTTGDAGATRADCQVQFYDFSPRIPRYGQWIRHDKRLSLDAMVQAEVADNFRVWGGLQYNERDNNLIDYNWVFDLTATSRYDLTKPVTVDDRGNVIGLTTAPTVTNGAATAGAGSIFNTEKRDFAYFQSSTYWKGGFEWDLGPLQIEGLGVTSKSKTFGDTNRVVLHGSPSNVEITLDPDDGTPSFKFTDGFDPNNVASYYQGAFLPARGPRLDWRPTELYATEDQLKLDFDYETGVPFLDRLEWGAQYRKATALSYGGGGYLALNADGTTFEVPSANLTIIARTDGAQDDLSDPVAPLWTPATLQAFLAANTQMTPGSFYNQPGYDRSGVPDKWLAPTFNDLSGFFDTSGFDHSCVQVCAGYRQPPAYDVKEKIAAGYFKVNIESSLFGMPLHANTGLRVVHTADTATGSYLLRELYNDPVDPSIIRTRTVGTRIISLKNDYWDWLPAVNAALEVTPTILLRGNWSKVMARPRFNDLAPNANCLIDVTTEGQDDDINDGCSAGNPYLKPYRADQFDLNIGWFPNRDTAFSVGYYQKNIKSFILSQTLQRNVNFFGDGKLYDVNMPINGEGATQKGFEVSGQTAFTFLPSPLDGFGVIANYTFSDSSNVDLIDQLTGGQLPYPYLSKHSYNVIGYYEKYGIAARLAYNWRSKYLLTPADRSGNPVFRDASGYLDARVGYTFELGPVDKLELFVEGKNLTGTAERTTAGDIRMSELAYSGRRFFLGLRASF